MRDDYIFLVLVLIAVVVMVVIYAMGSLAPIPGQVGETTSIAEFNLGTIGFVSEVPAKTFTIGSLTIGEPQEENLKSAPRVDITASWFGSEGKRYIIDVPEWYFDTMEKVTLTFSVDSTNMYENLYIAWNGKLFYQDKAHPRTYKLEIEPQYVEEQNTLDIYTGAPGLMFWANTVYQLRDLSVDLVYGPAKLYSFELYSSEVGKFRKGLLEFYGTGGGELTAKVNGIEIYSQVPRGTEEVEFTFSDVPLNTGDNILTLTSKGTTQLFDAALRIYLLVNEVSRQKEFNLTGQELASMQQGLVKGRITYQVDGISREGIVRVKLNGNSLSVPAPVEGMNTVYFTHSQAREGKNTLEFSSTGSYQVSTVDIGLERA